MANIPSFASTRCVRLVHFTTCVLLPTWSRMLSICSHRAFLRHGAVHKVSRDIMEVGNVWAVDLSPLELQNAETKRVATFSGSKRLVLSTEGYQRQAM
eukprot:4276276-Pleurochrysis_carterae.AAC.3